VIGLVLLLHRRLRPPTRPPLWCGATVRLMRDTLGIEMGKTLVICEKPSVAKDVAQALPGRVTKDGDALKVGDQWLVSHAVGHLVEQVDPDKYDAKYKRWKYEDLPIIPTEFKYQARDTRARAQLKSLHALMAREDVDRIVNACDAGREGELIFKLIAQTAPKKAQGKEIVRAWFSSMTSGAIQDAFANLRPDREMKPLEDAARARSEADWLVGMNATRAATVRAGSARQVLSLGRVQTPTLALIVRRDVEIREFVAEDYWEVHAIFQTATGPTYPAQWHDGGTLRLDSAAAADQIVTACTAQRAVVESIETKPHRQQPPLLYDLTTLQREANSRFGFSASRTLAAAQSLYEAHKVLTYPRTDSKYLPSDMAGSLASVAAAVGRAGAQYADGAAYVRGLSTLPLGRVINDAKVSDHHAIIPTDQTPSLTALSADERRIWDLVARRFLAVFHPECVTERTTIETRCAGHLFRSKGQMMIEPGWRAVYLAGAPEKEASSSGDQPANDVVEDDGAAEAADTLLPILQEGNPVGCTGIESQAKQTKPPAHYSEGTLLKAMETAGRLIDDEELAEQMKDQGLGTPATRAATIERLIGADYVERNGKQLLATEKAIGLIQMLGDHLLARPDLTGEWEEKLHKIEAGELPVEEFRAGISDFTSEVVKWFATVERKDLRVERRAVGPCPVCPGTIVEYPKHYGCDSYKGKDEPGCGYTIWKRSGTKTVSYEDAVQFVAAKGDPRSLVPERVYLGDCPSEACDGQIVERPRSYGCTSWKGRATPGCGFVIYKRIRGGGEVDLETARAMVARGESMGTPTVKDVLAPCPSKGCAGEIVDRGKGWGCDSWKSRAKPGCGFVVWKKERGASAELTRAQALERIEAERTRQVDA